MISRFCRRFTTVVASHGSPILFRKEGHVGVITFNRPESFNAMTVEMGEEFEKLIASLHHDKDIRALVLTGAGKAFSAGGDLKFLLARCNDTPANNSLIMRKFYSRFLSLLHLPVPIISAINGPAIGAGACVAAATDFTVMSASADIGFTFASLGLHGGMGCTHTLPLLLGSQKAAYLLQTGAVLKGQQAKDFGLVTFVEEDAEKTVAKALSLAHDIGNHPVAATKTMTQTLRNRILAGMESALWREADSQALCYATEELKQKVTAMMNRKKK